jgi:hypothetical protein
MNETPIGVPPEVISIFPSSPCPAWTKKPENCHSRLLPISLDLFFFIFLKRFLIKSK